MTGAARAPLPVGVPAPDFALRDQYGAPRRLSDLRGRVPVAVLFYPWAFSRVCSSELAALRDTGPLPGGGEVWAVSCDPVYSLRAYAEQDGLELPLLSDFWPHGAVAREYGVFDEERGAACRSTYLVGLDGVIRWAVHHPSGEARPLSDLLTAFTGVQK